MLPILSEKTIFLLLISLAVLLEVAGDILFKKWAIENRQLLLLVGLIVYFVGTIAWAFSLKYDYISKAISILSVLNLVIIVLVGVLFFNEQLSLPNKIGIVFGVLSVVLLEAF